MSGLDASFTVIRDDFTLTMDLRIKPGESLALLGPNGAGKSTAVDAIAGLIPLSDGTIKLNGRRLDGVVPEDRSIGVVFQHYLLFPHLTVLENVAFGPRSRGTPKYQARRDALDILGSLELESLAQRRPGDLSGGQGQRVALARALAAKPDLLLLDEPMAALDVSTRSQLRRSLARHLQDFAGPRLLITHDPTDAFLLADQVAILENGRIVQIGTPTEIRQHPTTPYVADLAGTNLFAGSNQHGQLQIDNSSHGLTTSHHTPEGPVLITIHPAAVSVHRDRPGGSPRNSWPTTIEAVEPLGEVTRLILGEPLTILADVTPAAVAELGLRVGDEVWASVKATEIAISPR